MCARKSAAADPKLEPPPSKSVGLRVNYGAPNFRWQMVFNSFSVERLSNGTLLRVAYVVNSAAAEVVPILVCEEGLKQFSDSAVTYVQDLGEPVPFAGPHIPSTARVFSPLFSNHIRIARSGSSAEFAFYTIPLKEIAQAAKGNLPANAQVDCVQVALLHSGVTLHQQVVLALIASLPAG